LKDEYNQNHNSYKLLLKAYLDETMNALLYDDQLTTITVRAASNGNTDNRDGGCGDLKIPLEEFTFTVNRKTGITIRDLVGACYRVKGSKYD
jgi:hypothetical protein